MYTGKVQKSGKGRKSAIRHLKPAHSAQAVKVLFCLVDSAVSLGSAPSYLCADHTALVGGLQCIP